MDTQILDTPAVEKPVLEYASTSARFANYILDIIGIYVLVFVAAFIVGMLAPGLIDMNDSTDKLLFYLFYFALFFTYYTVFERNFGKTPGKFITRTHVVTEGGERPSTKSILRRTLCRLIPFEPFSFLNSSGGWHDSISKTMVVKDQK